MLRNQQVLLISLLILVFTCCAYILVAAGQVPFNKQELKIIVVIAFVIISLLIFLLAQRIKSHENALHNTRAEMLGTLNLSESEKLALLDAPLDQLAEKLRLQLERSRKAESMIFDYAREIVCSLDSEYRICELNANAELYLGLPFPRLLGAALPELCIDEERDRFKEFLSNSQREKAAINCESRFKKTASAPIDLHWSVEWSPTAQRFYCVGEDISPQKQIERLRAELTQMVSHDLRAPIAALSAFLETMLSGEFGEPNASGKKAAAVCRDNVDQMLRLINQLLDAEKVESGTITIELHDAPLEAIIESAVNLLRPLADQRKIKIEVQGNESSFLVHADFDRSVQIVLNILSNAIKWSPEAGTVTLRQIDDAGFVKLEIIDQGPGISPEFRDKMFGRFQSGAEGAQLPSSGLGLYLARKLAELQDAELGVNSELGKGSCFWIRMKKFEIDSDKSD